MDYTIEQLNFLYLYKYCVESHIDVSAYDYLHIEEVISDDITTILNYILVKIGISKSYEEFSLGSNVEKFISQSDTENLAQVGVVLNRKIQQLTKFKNDILNLSNRTSEKDFIELFDNLMVETRDIKSIITALNSVKPKAKQSINENNKKKAANFLFS